jgi:hypothetical protein
MDELKARGKLVRDITRIIDGVPGGSQMVERVFKCKVELQKLKIFVKLIRL